MQNFDSAATRHLHDAALLHGSGRLPNADHLAGFATECALKAILISFLGAQQTTGKPYSTIGGQKKDHGHLPGLWDEVKMVLNGRTGGPVFSGLLTHNPFTGWSVNDRYGDGSGVTAQTLAARLTAAQKVLGHLQNAKILGTLP
ncbi:hypothetical protein OG836_29015 [Micromonospora zamorensis]|uniref:hypothetical protein n=1 Tax=Micromonospora zamorensis TaxID=709883 RepID=UPI002E1FB31D